MNARMVGWILVGLAGLAVAVALSVAASNLSTQPIGLSNEPLRAGERLAPAVGARTTPTRKKAKRRKPTPAVKKTATTPAATAPAPAPTVTTPAPTTTSGGDDHGGRRNRGRGSDD
jgi:hypothetical protein